MLFNLKSLNEDATLNNWMDIGAARIVRGADAKLILQIFQPDRKIRYILPAPTVVTVDFLKSDGTTLTKTATFPFADDRSIVEIDLTDTETLTLISQNILAKLNNVGDISFAMLQQGLQMVSTTSNC